MSGSDRRLFWFDVAIGMVVGVTARYLGAPSWVAFLSNVSAYHLARYDTRLSQIAWLISRKGN